MSAPSGGSPVLESILLGIIGFLLFIPAMAFPLTDAWWRESWGLGFHRSRPPLVAGFCSAALFATVLVPVAGLLVRFAPGIPRFVLDPITTRLRPSHGKWLLLAGALFLAAFGVFLHFTLGAIAERR